MNHDIALLCCNYLAKAVIKRFSLKMKIFWFENPVFPFVIIFSHEFVNFRMIFGIFFFVNIFEFTCKNRSFLEFQPNNIIHHYKYSIKIHLDYSEITSIWREIDLSAHLRYLWASAKFGWSVSVDYRAFQWISNIKNNTNCTNSISGIA